MVASRVRLASSPLSSGADILGNGNVMTALCRVVRAACAGRYKAGQPNVLTLCGVLMHSSLAVTLTGTPLGLTAAKFWTRTKFKGTLALKRHINPTRVPIETKECYRWRTCASRSRLLAHPSAACMWMIGRATPTSSYCTAQDVGTSFLVRVQTNRLAERPADAAPHDPAHRVFAQLAAAPWAGPHRTTVDQDETTWLQVKFAAINTLPPVGKQKRYGPQVLLTSTPSKRIRRPVASRSTGSW